MRELLALQSSDWAFMVTRELAGDYSRGRADGHARALDTELRAIGSDAAGPAQPGAWPCPRPLYR